MVTAGKLGVKSGEGFYDYSESKKAEKVAERYIKF
jgi:3-hydroxybutyryl-CoA dehydrogenase